ncbi:hypothetical protein T190_31755 [Sinorhizobium meliloti CCBAU 01290]|nr:hypothetical protein T190_31755 [Sinorhizobium meliloti CCBAU 01290]
MRIVLSAERELDRDCDEAEFLAARLISLFQSGVHDREMLRRVATPEYKTIPRSHLIRALAYRNILTSTLFEGRHNRHP